MADQKRQLMPATSNTWIVEVGKREYQLNDQQIQLIKEATKAGKNGLVWFKDFAISLPHISTIYRKPNPPTTWKKEYEGMAVDPRGLERIKQLREKHGI